MSGFCRETAYILILRLRAPILWTLVTLLGTQAQAHPFDAEKLPLDCPALLSGVSRQELVSALAKIQTAHREVEKLEAKERAWQMRMTAYHASLDFAKLYNHNLNQNDLHALPMGPFHYGEAAGMAYQQLEGLAAKPLQFRPSMRFRYLSSSELKNRKVLVRSGRLYWAESGLSIENAANAIFVIGLDRELYLARPEDHEPSFHHGAFFSGDPVLGAGTINTDAEGRLTRISNESGHYVPKELDLQRVVRWLKTRGLRVGRDQIKVQRGT